MDERFHEQAAALEQEQRDAAIAGAARALQGAGQPYCDDCDDVIPADRRAAMPHAIRCVHCQNAFERATR